MTGQERGLIQKVSHSRCGSVSTHSDPKFHVSVGKIEYPSPLVGDIWVSQEVVPSQTKEAEYRGERKGHPVIKDSKRSDIFCTPPPPLYLPLLLLFSSLLTRVPDGSGSGYRGRTICEPPSGRQTAEVRRCSGVGSKSGHIRPEKDGVKWVRNLMGLNPDPIR